MFTLNWKFALKIALLTDFEIITVVLPLLLTYNNSQLALAASTVVEKYS